MFLSYGSESIRVDTLELNTSSNDGGDEELERFKLFVLFKLAELGTSNNRTTLNQVKREVAKYKVNSYILPSNEILEGKIKRALIRQKSLRRIK